MIRHILSSRRAHFGAGIALSVSAALLISLTAYVPVEAAAPTVVPNAAQPEPAGTFTAPDPVSAQVDARVKGQKIEVLSELTPTSTTWANPNGSFTTESYGTPIRVADTSSKSGWDDIDYTLQKNSDGTVSPKVDNVPVVLSGAATATQAASKGVVSVANGSASSVAFGWSGALPQPTLDGDTATYADVEPNMDLVVKMTATGFEQYFILKAAPTAAEMSLILPLVTKGLSAKQQADGSVTFANAKKQSVAVIPSAYMWDARTDPNTGLPSDQVQLGVSGINLGAAVAGTSSAVIGSTGTVAPPTGDTSVLPATPSLTLTPPATFFADPNVQYPVTIDPSVTEGSSGDDYVRSGADATTKYQSYDPSNLEVGYSGTSGIWARAFLNFSASGWESQDVTAASLKLYENHSWNCTAEPMNIYPASNLGASVTIANTTYNSGQPSVLSSSVTVAPSFAKGTSCSDAGYETITVTNIASYLAGKNESTVDFALRASETNDLAWKIFNSSDATSNKPSLSVTYDRYPSTATTPTLTPSQSYGSTLYAASTTPTLATTVADADGGTTKATLEVDSNTTGTVVASCVTPLVTQATAASCKPTTALTNGTTYYLRALGSDGTVSSKAWSAYTPFVVQAALPPTPTVTCPAPYVPGYWGSTVPTSPVSCTATVPAPAAGQSPTYELLVSLDGATAAPTAVTVGSSGSVAVTVPNTNGSHSVSVTSVAPSGLTAETTNGFGYGGAAITVPDPAAPTAITTTDRVYLTASSDPLPPSGSATAQIQWRSSDADSWHTGSAALPITNNGSAGIELNNYAWSTLTGTSGATGPIQVQVCFTYSNSTVDCTSDHGNIPLAVDIVLTGFGNNYPTAAAGDGQVSLWTGEFQTTATDFSPTTLVGDLSVTRTYDSLPSAIVKPTVFGPGWNASFSAAIPGTVQDTTGTDGTITIASADGSSSEQFQETSGGDVQDSLGTYALVGAPTTGTSDQIQIQSGTPSGTYVLTLTASDGTKTVWNSAGSGASEVWSPVSVSEAPTQSAEGFTADSAGRVTSVMAKLPEGATNGYCTPSGSPAALPAGCSALNINYGSGTPTGLGDYQGQVSSIWYETWDPTANSGHGAETATEVDAYQYNSAGLLITATTFPGTTYSKTVTYTYDTTSYTGRTLLTSEAQPGTATTTYNYSNATGDVRLANVVVGAANTGGAPSQTSYVYNVSPSSTGLANFSDDTVSSWGQQSAPFTSAAVFGADQTVNTDNASTLTAESGWTSSQWKTATFDYTDQYGNETNTAEFGAGEWLRTYTGYNSAGTPATALTTAEIDAAVAGGSGGSAGALVFDSTTDSSLPVDTFSAPFTAMVAGTPTLVRTHTHYTYDAGAPDGDVVPNTAVDGSAGTPFDLPTHVVVTLANSAGSTVVMPADVSPAVTISDTTNGYDPIDGAASDGPTSGWMLGTPTVVTTQTGTGAPIVKEMQFDSYGNTIKSFSLLPDGTHGTTTLTQYYSFTSSGSNCPTTGTTAEPQWAGLECWTGPDAQPSDASTPTYGPISSTTTNGYNLWLEPQSTTEITPESPHNAIRTTTMTYLADGRADTTSIAMHYVDGSTFSDPAPVDTTKDVYDPTTHVQTGTEALNPSGGIDGSDTSTFDQWGRTTSYTDSSGGTTTTSYIAPGNPGAGNVYQVVTPSGPSSTETSTYSYDGTDALGNEEHRGLATGLTITNVVGSFSAAYDTAGNLVQQNMPAGLTEAWQYNSGGQPASLTYSGDVKDETSGTTSTGSWLSYSRSYDDAGRVAQEYTPDGGTDLISTGYQNAYTYDEAGRLIDAQSASTDDSATTSCVDDAYSFDTQGNRTALTKTTYAANPCTDTNPSDSSATSSSYAYDNFSRQLTGVNGSGSYMYDAFGRQTTIPAADAPNGANQAITMGYFDNDAVQSISQGPSGSATTTTFTLDPDGRRLTSTQVSGSTTTVTTNHYSDGSDSPSWSSQIMGSSTTSSNYLSTLGSSSVVTTTDSNGTTVTLSLADLTGSVVASVVVPTSGDASGMSGFSSFDEYGIATSADANTGVNDYGWDGAGQRAVTNAGLILMGARVFSSQTGRFSSPDPIVDGNENAYNYPDDPIDSSDTTGQYSFPGVYNPGAGGFWGHIFTMTVHTNAESWVHIESHGHAADWAQLNQAQAPRYRFLTWQLLVVWAISQALYNPGTVKNGSGANNWQFTTRIEMVLTGSVAGFLHLPAGKSSVTAYFRVYVIVAKDSDHPVVTAYFQKIGPNSWY